MIRNHIKAATLETTFFFFMKSCDERRYCVSLVQDFSQRDWGNRKQLHCEAVPI